MLIAVKSKRFSVTGYKRMFVILIKKTLGSGFKYSAFDYCEYILLSRFTWGDSLFSSHVGVLIVLSLLQEWYQELLTCS